MTTQPDDAHTHADSTTETTDPIGPMVPPNRSKLGSRALALFGVASVAALSAHSLIDGNSTWTTIDN